MAAPPNMNSERYNSLSKNQKVGYWCFVGFVASLVIYVWFFYEPPKKANEVRRSQSASSSATAVKK